MIDISEGIDKHQDKIVSKNNSEPYHAHDDQIVFNGTLTEIVGY